MKDKDTYHVEKCISILYVDTCGPKSNKRNKLKMKLIYPFKIKIQLVASSINDYKEYNYDY